MIKKLFMTGSRVYGTPTEDSDWDIVVRLERDEAASIFGLPLKTWNGDHSYEMDANGHQFKIGDVNLILCFTDTRFESWETGTNKLKAIAPTTRSVAVAMFKSLFAEEKKKVTA